MVAWGFMTVYGAFTELVGSSVVPAKGEVISVRAAAQANRNPKAEFRFVTPDGVSRTSETYVTGGKQVARGDSIALGVLPHWPYFAYTQDHLQKRKDGRLMFGLIWLGALLGAFAVRGFSRRLVATS